MNPAQVKLVQESFGKVAPISEQAAAAVLRAIVRDRATDVKQRCFKGDMKEQGLETDDDACGRGGDLPPKYSTAILPAASASPSGGMSPTASRHSHYAPVGAALLWTLERGLGARNGRRSSPQPGPAAYGVLSSYMIGEAHGRPAAAE